MSDLGFNMNDNMTLNLLEGYKWTVLGQLMALNVKPEPLPLY